MKQYLKIFWPVSLIIVIGSLTFIYAQVPKRTDGRFPDGAGKGFRPPPGLPGAIPPPLLEKLGLTDAQNAEIKTLEEAARAASQTHFDKLATLDAQLKATAAAESFNEEEARQLLAVKAQTLAELELIRLKTGAAIKNLLTPEQKTRLEELNAQRPEPPRGDFRPAGRP